MPNQSNSNWNKRSEAQYNYTQRGSANRSNRYSAPSGIPFEFPWWVIVLGFVIWWPLGFLGIGANVFFKNYKPPKSTVQQPQATVTPPPKTAPATSSQPQQKSHKGDNASTILMIVGAALAAAGVLAAVGSIGGPLPEIITGILCAATGLGLCLGGNHMRLSGRMRKKIVNIVGKADSMYIEDLATAIPCSYEKCCTLLESCIEKGLFGDSAYLDMRTRCLVVRGKPPVPAAPEKKAAAPVSVSAPKGNERYEQILKELRTLNAQIPGEEMSDKISRLEKVSAKIFNQAETSPRKLPQMRKFMDYYLPTALKLLKTYAELDSQGIEGDNISESKRRIEQAMDTLVVAFENQLDQLFQGDAMDVSTDIDVMENMLAADGLTRNNDPFNLYHQSAPKGFEPPKQDE